MEVKNAVKYEAELDRDFVRWLTSTPLGEKVRQCIQCGACSGSCPMSIYMDYTPRKLIALAREGFKDEVLRSYTIWLCASCYACTVECPVQISITDLMYMLRERAIAEGLYPRRFPTPVYAQEFTEMVAGRGRSTESLLVVKANMRLSPLDLVKMIPLGWRLWRKGRIGMTAECVKDQAEIRQMLDALEEPYERKKKGILSRLFGKKHA
jgi:quinone-modifying oxidoreductase subunit QmoC